MEAVNYHTRLSVTASPEAVYHAVTDGYQHWWTAPDKPFCHVGDQAKFSFPPLESFWVFEAAILEPVRRMEMVCVQSHMVASDNPAIDRQEWLGTRVIWRLESTETGTEIWFEHVGLTPDQPCYDMCEKGWDFFLLESLQDYLDIGTGHPHQPSVS